MASRDDAILMAAELDRLSALPGIQIFWQETIRRGALLLREWPVDAPAVETPPLDAGVSAFDHDGNGKVGGSKKKGKS